MPGPAPKDKRIIPEKLRGLSDADLAIKVLEGYCAECFAEPLHYGDYIHYPWCSKRKVRDPMGRYSYSKSHFTQEYLTNFDKEN